MSVNLYTRYRFATLRKTKHGSAKRLVSQYAPLAEAAVADSPLLPSWVQTTYPHRDPGRPRTTPAIRSFVTEAWLADCMDFKLVNGNISTPSYCVLGKAYEAIEVTLCLNIYFGGS